MFGNGALGSNFYIFMICLITRLNVSSPVSILSCASPGATSVGRYVKYLPGYSVLYALLP